MTHVTSESISPEREVSPKLSSQLFKSTDNYNLMQKLAVRKQNITELKSTQIASSQTLNKPQLFKKDQINPKSTNLA